MKALPEEATKSEIKGVTHSMLVLPCSTGHLLPSEIEFCDFLKIHDIMTFGALCRLFVSIASVVATGGDDVIWLK